MTPRMITLGCCNRVQDSFGNIHGNNLYAQPPRQLLYRTASASTDITPYLPLTTRYGAALRRAWP